MLKTFERCWRWEPRGLGPYETIRGRMMSRAMLGVGFGIALDLPMQLLLPGPMWVSLIPLAFLAVYGLGLRFLWNGHPAWAATLVIGWTALFLGAAMVPFGGLAGPMVIFVVTGAMVSVMWLDARAATAAIAMWIAMLLLTPIASRRVVVAPVLQGDDLRATLLICVIVATIEVAFLVGLTVDALNAASREADLRAAEATRAASAARTAMAAKSRFLATMSHELRTPLNAILGYTGLLRDEGGPSTADLVRIEKSGQQLLALVEDVLELARADSTTGPG